MTIRIIDEQPISLTREDYDRLHRSWQSSQSMTAHPQDFESFVRSHKKQVADAIERVEPLLKNWRS